MKVLEPLRLGRGTRLAIAPSRVMFGPHETNLGKGRAFSERHVAYYGRRAAGGAGIIVTEEASVHPSDWPYERCPSAETSGDGWRAVARAVHDHGAVCLAAIGHSGGQGASAYNQRPLWAPSPVPEVATREVPKVMEPADIAAVVEGYGAATAVACAAGMDGVEVNAGQFSLIRQFLSGLTNMREDPYGHDRVRFAREVLAAVRDGAGDAVVALRLSVDEMAPWAGIVPEVGAAIAVELAPYVDMITVVRGSIFTTWATRPDGHISPGFAIDLARQVRDGLATAGITGVSVVAQGSIVDWGQAEWALDSGAADAVEMTRAQLADAEFVAKLRAGRGERIRPCILCNQTCKVRDNRNPIVTCVVDPRTGFELEDAPIPDAGRPAHGGTVSVVGAGPAGLEAARVAALDGWRVRVVERAAATGGIVRAAQLGAGRERLGRIADWLEQECRHLGVQISFARDIDETELAAMTEVGPVLLCTGGRASERSFLVDVGATVVEADTALRDGVPPGRVLVWDPVGGPIAISVAERLGAEDGRSVMLVTPDLLVGEKLSLSGDLAPSQARLHGLRIELEKRSLLRQVRKGSALLEDRFSAAQREVPADVVVNCGHRVPDATLGTETALRAGDAVAPRTILEAMLEGRRLALSLRR